MRILALDVAIKTGWAVLKDGYIESGMQDFTLKRGESKGMLFLYFNLWLTALTETIQPELIVYELAHHRGGHATEICVGLVTRIEELVAKRKSRGYAEIEYCGVHSATLKKHTTGSGRASKDEMKAAISKRLGRDITDDNEADALALLYYARDTLTG